MSLEISGVNRTEVKAVLDTIWSGAEPPEFLDQLKTQSSGGKKPDRPAMLMRSTGSQLTPRSQTASNLREKANSKGISVTLTRGDDNTGVKKSKVIINLNEMKNFKEAAESTLFEINNALNSEKKENLRGQLKRGELSLLDFGEKMAYLEHSSTKLVADILVEMRNHHYRPSIWGTKQEAAARRSSVQAIKAPHDLELAKTTPYFGLPSNEFYAFIEIAGEGSQSTALSRLRPILKIMASVSRIKGDQKITISNRSFGERVLDLTRFGTRAKLYICYTALLCELESKSDWRVTWAKHEKQKWLFTESMKKQVILGLHTSHPSSYLDDALSKITQETNPPVRSYW